MKRLAFFMIVGLVLVGIVGRRESRARDEVRRAATQVVVVHSGDDWDGEEGSSIVITRGNQGRTRHVVQKAVPAPPRPPQPPQPPHHPPAPRKGAKPAPFPSTDSDKPTPDWFPRDRRQEQEAAKLDKSGRRILVGPLSASPTEAKQALRERVRTQVFEWLAPELTSVGEPSDPELDALIRDSYVQPVLVDTNRSTLGAGLTFGAAGVAPLSDDLYTIYKAAQIVDFSEPARDRIVQASRQRLVHERMIKGGGILAFALLTLGALTGYVRVDEASKGKRRLPLRVLTTAALAGGAFALYRWMA